MSSAQSASSQEIVSAAMVMRPGQSGVTRRAQAGRSPRQTVCVSSPLAITMNESSGAK